MPKKPVLHIKHDAGDAFEFSFTDADGKVTGHVSVPTEDKPDKRTAHEKLDEAKKKIKHLSKAFHKAAKEDD